MARGADTEDVAGELALILGRPVELGGEPGEELIHAWLEEAGHADELAQALAEKLRSIFPQAAISITAIQGQEDQDWLLQWRQSVKPLALGNKIIVSPTFATPAPGHGRVELTLDPGMAFGSGHHATTAMCAAALEKYSAPSMLDVGCGAGILAIIAVKLGATRALAIDIDPEAIRVTRENLELNQVSTQVEARVAAPENVLETFPLIAANLFMEPHLRLAGEYWRLCAPGGWLILSGIRQEQAP
ncbi:MAG: 50S ribosomal protein L11 methyltransferase, partial [Nitrospinota bacterium]|nr:50S ribosomal protein L11 methyltransferase [Nitrospinota bacterium]